MLSGRWTAGLTQATLPEFLGFWPQTENYTIGFPGTEVFGLGLSYASGFTGSPACI